MPLMFFQHIDSDTKLGLWQITESEDFFVTPGWEAPKIAHPQKRIQHLAGRFLLKTLEPSILLEDILLTENGQPWLPGRPIHFSISHCRNKVAVMVGKKDRMGLDIEEVRPTIVQVASKFMTASELSLMKNILDPIPDAATLAWTIKEAVFKWYGKGGVDFKQDMQILQLDRYEKDFASKIQWKKTPQEMLECHSIFLEDLWVTWTT